MAKMTIECFYANFSNNNNGDISVVKKNTRIRGWFIALLYPKGVLKGDSSKDVVVLV